MKREREREQEGEKWKEVERNCRQECWRGAGAESVKRSGVEERRERRERRGRRGRDRGEGERVERERDEREENDERRDGKRAECGESRQRRDGRGESLAVGGPEMCSARAARCLRDLRVPSLDLGFS